MINNYNELTNEIDSLKGNINRMCVTNDIIELESMYEWTLKRINTIYEYAKQRIDINVD